MGYSPDDPKFHLTNKLERLLDMMEFDIIRSYDKDIRWFNHTIRIVIIGICAVFLLLVTMIFLENWFSSAVATGSLVILILNWLDLERGKKVITAHHENMLKSFAKRREE